MQLAECPAAGSVLGPAEFIEGLLEAGEGQADDVEVAALDAGNEAAGAALDTVGARLVVFFPGGEVARDLFRREGVEVHQGGLGKGDALGIGQTDKGDAGDDGVGAPGKLFEHPSCVVRRARLAEDVAVERYFGVGSDDDRGAHATRRDQFGLGGRQTLDEVLGGFARIGSFVDRGGEHGKRDSRVPKNFGASRRCGSKNQLHSDSRREEYYRASAVTAWALVQPKRRAICAVPAPG